MATVTCVPSATAVPLESVTFTSILVEVFPLGIREAAPALMVILLGGAVSSVTPMNTLVDWETPPAEAVTFATPSSSSLEIRATAALPPLVVRAMLCVPLGNRPNVVDSRTCVPSGTAVPPLSLRVAVTTVELKPSGLMVEGLADSEMDATGRLVAP